MQLFVQVSTPTPPRPTPAFSTTSFTTLNTSYHNSLSSPISYMFQNPVLSPSLHIHSLTLPHHLQSLLLLSTYWHLLSSTIHITCPMISPSPCWPPNPRDTPITVILPTSPYPSLSPHIYLTIPMPTSPLPQLPHHPHGYLTIPIPTSPAPYLPSQPHVYLSSPIPTSPLPYLPPLPPFPGMLANSSYSLPRTPDGYLGHCVDGDSLGDSIVPSATLDALQGHLAYRFHLFPCTFHFILV